MVKSGAGRVKAALCAAEQHPRYRTIELRVGGPPVRGAAATARLPRSVGADIAGPLGLCKIAAGAETEGSDQFLFVEKPQLDLAVVAVAGQPTVIDLERGRTSQV
jgi:hypothetical protein